MTTATAIMSGLALAGVISFGIWLFDRLSLRRERVTRAPSALWHGVHHFAKQKD